MTTLRIAGLRIVGAAIAGFVIASLAPAQVYAQTPKPHPDFSGTWLFDEAATGAVATVERKGFMIFGEWFTIRQNDKFLTMEITIAKGIPPVPAVYALDGSATQNVSPPQTPGGAPIIVTAKAKWVGRKLVVESKSQQPGGPGKDDPKVVDVVSTRAFWLDEEGRLVIDREGTPKPIVPTTRSVYKKQ
jgi:hypothetical protein